MGNENDVYGSYPSWSYATATRIIINHTPHGNKDLTALIVKNELSFFKCR